MSDDYKPFKLDVETYIRDLPWSNDASEDEKTLVAGNLRTLYALLENEVRGVAEALERWIVERELTDFPTRLLLAEVAKLHPDRWDVKSNCSCGESETCDECSSPETVQALIESVEREKIEVEAAENAYIESLTLDHK